MASNTAALVCDVCGFDNGPATGDTGRCAGCGVPLEPSSDHAPPAPGFTVPHYPDAETSEPVPYVVTDADRERYPELAGVVVVRKNAYEWGRGIGAEPYGYFTRSWVAVVELPDFEAGRRLDLPDECPECGATRALFGTHQDRAAIAWSESAECLTCETTLAADRGA